MRTRLEGEMGLEDEAMLGLQRLSFSIPEQAAFAPPGTVQDSSLRRAMLARNGADFEPLETEIYWRRASCAGRDHKDLGGHIRSRSCCLPAGGDSCYRLPAVFSAI